MTNGTRVKFVKAVDNYPYVVVQVGEIAAAGYIVDPSKEISDPAAYDTVTGTYAV